MRSVTAGITRPYSAAEAWLYDRLIAPAVMDMKSSVEDRLVAELPPDAELLEVGSGGGQVAVHLATRRPDLRIVGLDLSPEQTDRAARRAASLGNRLRFTTGDVHALPFPDASFDVVLSVASIKHWAEPARGLAECARVLRPGGRVAIIEADRGCRHEDAKRFVSGWRIPDRLRPLALAFFRTFVAGQSLDLDEARALMARLPLSEHRVERIAGTPALLMWGRA